MVVLILVSFFLFSVGISNEGGWVKRESDELGVVVVDTGLLLALFCSIPDEMLLS